MLLITSLHGARGIDSAGYQNAWCAYFARHNRVWLTDYTEQGGNLLMHGSAVNYEDLSSFAQKLKTSKYFSNVTIKKASQKDTSGSVEWEIACSPNYTA